MARPSTSLPPVGESGDANGDGFSDSIYSTRGNSSGQPSYGYMNGTSMATPHVAGVLALMKSINPDLSPDDVDNLLISGKMTDDLGVTGRDNETGHGLINAYKAVAAAQAPYLSTTVSTLHLGVSETAENVAITGFAWQHRALLSGNLSLLAAGNSGIHRRFRVW